MRYRLLICLLLAWALGSPRPGRAQGEANHWYFGNGAGLDFSNGAPRVVLNGQCCDNYDMAGIYPVTMSDSLGRLQFYSNNNKIWDRTHTLFHPYNTISSGSSYDLATPWPGRPGHYLYFSRVAPPPNVPPGGPDVVLAVSEIDMHLRGGLGDVVDATKKRIVEPDTDQSIALARHANGRDFWLITHAFAAATYRVYLISPAGLSTQPVISNVGLPAFTFAGLSLTNLRLSPNGRLLCRTGQGIDFRLELLPFDAATGRVGASLLTLGPGGGGDPRYNNLAEFSPDSRQLYTRVEYQAAIPGDIVLALHQYDVRTPTVAALRASRVTLDSLSVSTSRYDAFVCFQLGPDGRIYTGMQTDSLGVIAYPNRRGYACAYRHGAIWLGPPASNGQPRGTGQLPIFTSNVLYLANFSAPATVCLGDSVRLRLSAAPYLDSVRWRFGAPLHPTATSTRRPATAYRFAQPGTYRVAVRVYYHDGASDTLSRLVQVLPRPSLRRLPEADTLRCPAPDLLLRVAADQPGLTLRWHDGSTGPEHTASAPGTYTVTATNAAGCSTTHRWVVVCPERPGQMPNIITPNGDGRNDALVFPDLAQGRWRLEIYSRWGRLLFAQDAYRNGQWDARGLPDGTYFYRLSQPGQPPIKGWLDVLR